MESNLSRGELTFRAVESRLIAFVNARIQNGEFSERALARRLGISQSHLHNVLKGARRLQTSLADTFLAHFEISLLDLISGEELALVENSAPLSLGSVESGRLRLLRKRPLSALTSSAPEREAS